jgi:hypothetical protein
MARREEGAYRAYATDEQRSQPGWIGRPAGHELAVGCTKGPAMNKSIEVASSEQIPGIDLISRL